MVDFTFFSTTSFGFSSSSKENQLSDMSPFILPDSDKIKGYLCIRTDGKSDLDVDAYLNGNMDKILKGKDLTDQLKREKCGWGDSPMWFVFSTFEDFFKKRGDLCGMGCIRTASYLFTLTVTRKEFADLVQRGNAHEAFLFAVQMQALSIFWSDADKTTVATSEFPANKVIWAPGQKPTVTTPSKR